MKRAICYQYGDFLPNGDLEKTPIGAMELDDGGVSFLGATKDNENRILSDTKGNPVTIKDGERFFDAVLNSGNGYQGWEIQSENLKVV